VSAAAFCILTCSLYAADETVLISSISFSGNRVSEKTLRGAIPIREGDRLTEKSLEETYEALYAMRLFKTVAISTNAAGEGLAEVHITAKDGWYLIPMPFAVSGQGGSSAGLFLVSRNVFKKAESVSLSGATGSAGGAAAAFFEKDGRSLDVMHSERNAEEGLYTDGGFSSAQNMRKSDDTGNYDFLSKFGTLESMYKRRKQTNSISAGFPLARRAEIPTLSAALSYNGEKNTYGDGLKELHGGGRASSVSLELNAGGRGEKMDDLGVIFGLGLADLDKRIQNRTRTENTWRGGLNLATAGAWTGSDYAFSKTALSIENSTVWGRNNRFSVRCAGAISANAPESQLFATGRETGLIGQYAREFRAPRIASFGASFSKPITVSKRGILQAAVFAETAFDPAAYCATAQKGAGFSLFYRFWRFPLPLGFSQTYSFRDKNIQVSAAIGGRF
jgi:hypothetical protein